LLDSELFDPAVFAAPAQSAQIRALLVDLTAQGPISLRELLSGRDEIASPLGQWACEALQGVIGKLPLRTKILQARERLTKLESTQQFESLLKG